MMPLLRGAGRARILRYEVDAASDEWTRLTFRPPVLAVGCRHRRRVEFWAAAIEGDPGLSVDVMVVGTGQALPDEDVSYVGTATVPEGDVVWHLIQRG